MPGISTNSANLFSRLNSPLDPGLSSSSHFLEPKTLQTALEIASYKNSASSSLVDQALQSAETQLRAFATNPAFIDKMNLAFGTDWDVNVAKDFAQSWLNGSLSALPTIEIRSGAEINEANGAFAAQTNRIYLSSDFLGNNAKNPDAVTAVLLEEIGHAIDFRISKTDAAGDEGDIFSRLVRGETISASELLELKAENDHTVISINGQSFDIEMSQIAMASFQGKLYEAHQGVNNKIYTRYSLNVDATSWSDWKESGGETYNAPAMAALNDRLYESHRGTNNLIYTRYSTNGADWSEWKATDGLAYNAPTLAAVGGKLYQAHRGTDNNIYLRYATNLDATSWSSWKQAGGQTYSAPALASFQGKLYEAHRGTDNKIYTRYAINADANTWSEWKADGDATTENAPSMVEFKGNLYQSHRGFDNRIYTRSSRDGANWTDWNRAAGDTPDGFAIASDAPSMTVVGDRLYQAHQGNDNKIYTRSSLDGVIWSLWNEKGGETRAESQIIRFNETVNPSTNWNATVFIWDGNKGTEPSPDFYKNDPTNTTRIANLDLHSNVRADGKQGLSFDWGTGSPDGENQRLPNDYFAIRAYTVANFDGGQYTFRAKGDDGFQIMAKRQSDGKWFDITQGGWKSNESNISYTLGKGTYDIHFHYFERQGTSNFDFSWEQTGRSDRLAQLAQKPGNLASDEILEYRQLVNQRPESERNQWYRTLQDKTDYFNQRNNKSKGIRGYDGKYGALADEMCNLTALANCLTYLGVKNPDSSMQFEDALEKYRKDHKLGAKTSWITLAKIADDLGAKPIRSAKGSGTTKGSYDEGMIKSALDRGSAVMLSVKISDLDHIVRLQGYDNIGFIVDDPYGKSKLNGTKSSYASLNSKLSDSATEIGSNNKWTWAETKAHTKGKGWFLVIDQGSI